MQTQATLTSFAATITEYILAFPAGKERYAGLLRGEKGIAMYSDGTKKGKKKLRDLRFWQPYPFPDSYREL